MKQNVGRIDQLIRYGIAIAFAVLGVIFGNIIFWVLAAVIAITAAIGFCGLYRIFGINTCKLKD